MIFIHLETLTYPVRLHDIRAANPQVSMPDDPSFVPDGYAVVEQTPLPEYDKNIQKLEALPPENVGGVWRHVWQIVPLLTEEVLRIRGALSSEVRKKRDSLLAQSDWSQLPDSAVTDKAAWAVYRQALRDIPSQTGFPMQIVWPSKP